MTDARNDLSDTAPAERPNPDDLVCFVDNPHSPEAFVTCCAGYANHNGVTTLTFASDRLDYSDPAGGGPWPINRVVVQRLTMSTVAAQDLAVSLFEFLRSNGLAPDLTAPRQAMQ